MILERRKAFVNQYFSHDGHEQQVWLKDRDDTVQMCHCENGM